jgi:hypothetical protein
MNDSKSLLKSILGDRGYETLEKAIYKQRTQAVIDPLEYYLPLIVVPRALLSWLVQTIRPMKTGEIKDIQFPGRPEILVHFEKQDVDQYRAEFISGGRIIHSFEKQSLPAISGHLMTVGEMYDSFVEEKPKEKEESAEKATEKEETKPSESNSLDVVRQMVSLSNLQPQEDPENVKWAVSHANVRELTGVIGKLVDALTAQKINTDKIEEVLDKVSEKEVKDKQGDIETSLTPEEKNKEDMKAKAKDAGMSYQELDKLKAKPSADQKGPESKEVDSGTEAAEAEPKKDSAIAKEALAPTEMVPESADVVTRPSLDPAKTKVYPSASLASDYFKKKAELLLKPYSSDAQRRWAHTEAGTKALGGEEKVKEWDKESKGKDLPEKVSKEEMGKAEMPKGAGQPTPPAKPKEPKPPIPASNNPAASAAKQAQSSARGGYKPPKTPGAAMPKNPTAKPKVPPAPKAPAAPKAPGMAKGEYFKKILSNAPVKKTEKVWATTEEQLYKTECRECGKPEFVKGNDGQPKFTPCACFLVLKKDEEGRPYRFVQPIKKSDGSFDLKFAADADPEVVKMFLLTMKARLLLKKKHGI